MCCMLLKQVGGKIRILSRIKDQKCEIVKQGNSQGSAIYLYSGINKATISPVLYTEALYQTMIPKYQKYCGG